MLLLVGWGCILFVQQYCSHGQHVVFAVKTEQMARAFLQQFLFLRLESYETPPSRV